MSNKPKKGNAFKKNIIVLLLLIVVGAAAFGGMYFFEKKSLTTTSTTVKVKEITEVTYSLDEFLVNLINDDGLLYLKTTVYIGYEENKDLAEELVTKKPIIRDAIIASLRAKKNTDFSATGVEGVKKELITKVNPILTKGKISHIYINDIVISR